MIWEGPALDGRTPALTAGGALVSAPQSREGTGVVSALPAARGRCSRGSQGGWGGWDLLSPEEPPRAGTDPTHTCASLVLYVCLETHNRYHSLYAPSAEARARGPS